MNSEKPCRDPVSSVVKNILSQLKRPHLTRLSVTADDLVIELILKKVHIKSSARLHSIKFLTIAKRRVSDILGRSNYII